DQRDDRSVAAPGHRARPARHGSRPAPAAPELLSFDVVIRRGTVIDGTGADGRAANVAIEGDRIVRAGDVPEPGRIELDAAGCLVTPGFVDAHVHGDAILFSDRVHLPALHQGVTTYVIGQDG